MAGAQIKGDPVFGYYWAPTALMGMYDWYILEEPEFDTDVWDNILAAVDDDSLRPIDAACAYEAVSPINTVWGGLRDIAPDAVTVIDKMNIGLEQTNKASAWVKENEVQDWGEAAIWYMGQYESLWKTWVTTDAYNKIKDYLEEAQ